MPFYSKNKAGLSTLMLGFESFPENLMLVETESYKRVVIFSTRPGTYTFAVDHVLTVASTI
jgi:hypothetical protein